MKQPWHSHYNAICGDWVAKHNRTTRNGVGNCSSKTGWISTPERKKDDFEALFKRIFRRKITSAKNAFRARLPSKLLEAAIPMRSAETELQNTRELRAMASEIVAPKPDGSRRQSEKKTILKHFLKRFLEGKSLAPKWRKSADKSLSQPSCSHSNTIYEVQLQKTIVYACSHSMKQPWRSHYNAICGDWVAKHNRTTRNGVGNCSSKTGWISTPERKKDDFEALFKRIFRRKITSAKNAFRARLPSKLHRQLIHQHHLQSHLHCGNDPTVANHNGILSTAHARKTLETPFTMRNRSDHGPRMIRPWSAHDPTTHETVSQPSHRRGRSSRFGDGLCMEKHRVSCICYLSKTHFVRDFLQNSIGNSSTSTTCNPIYSEGTISLLTLSVTNSFPH